MNYLFVRLVSCLLLPCFIMDPAFADFGKVRSLCVTSFDSQALTSAGIWETHPRFSRAAIRAPSLLSTLLISAGLALGQESNQRVIPHVIQVDDGTEKQIAAVIKEFKDYYDEQMPNESKQKETIEKLVGFGEKAVSPLIDVMERRGSYDFYVADSFLKDLFGIFVRMKNPQATQAIIDYVGIGLHYASASEPAIQALGGSGSPAAGAVLARVVRQFSDFNEVTGKAIEALIQISVAQGAPLPELVDLMHDSDPAVAFMVTTRVLSDENPLKLSASRRSVLLREALEAFAQTSPEFFWQNRRGHELIKMSHHEPWLEDVIRKAAFTVPNIFEYRTEWLLTPGRFSDSVQEAVKKAQEALERNHLATRPVPLDEATRKEIDSLINDFSQKVAASDNAKWHRAHDRLKELKDQALPQLVEAAQHHSDPWVQLYAVEFLGALKDRRAVQPLSDMLRADIESGGGTSVIMSLEKIGDPSAAGVLLQAVEDIGHRFGNIDSVGHAVDALITLSFNKGFILPELHEAMHHSDPNVSSWAIIKVLAARDRFGLSPEENSNVLREALEAAMRPGSGLLWADRSFTYLKMASEEPWLEEFMVRAALADPTAFLEVSGELLRPEAEYSPAMKRGAQEAVDKIYELFKQRRLDPIASLELGSRLWNSEQGRKDFPDLVEIIQTALDRAEKSGHAKDILNFGPSGGVSYPMSWSKETWAAPYIQRALRLTAKTNADEAIKLGSTYGPPFLDAVLNYFKQEERVDSILDNLDFLSGFPETHPYLEWALGRKSAQGDYRLILNVAEYFRSEPWFVPDFMERALTQLVEKEGINADTLKILRQWRSAALPIVEALMPLLDNPVMTAADRISGLVALKQQPAFAQNPWVKQFLESDTPDWVKTLVELAAYPDREPAKVENMARLEKANARTLYTLLAYGEFQKAPYLARDTLHLLEKHMRSENLSWNELRALHGDFRFMTFINHIDRWRNAVQDPAYQQEMIKLLHELLAAAKSPNRAQGSPLFSPIQPLRLPTLRAA